MGAGTSVVVGSSGGGGPFTGVSVAGGWVGEGAVPLPPQATAAKMAAAAIKTMIMPSLFVIAVLRF